MYKYGITITLKPIENIITLLITIIEWFLY